MYFLYILRCKDKTLYTGTTSNLCRRFWEHNFSKKGAKYTKSKRPLELVFYQLFTNKSDALKKEISFKKLKKVDKEKIIFSFYGSISKI
jgi:putative endonuclease